MTDHTIPGRDVCHVRPNLKHNGTRLVAKQMRKEFVRTFDTINLTDLRTTNARGVDFDQHLPALERRNFDFIDDQRFALLDQDGGDGFQSFLLATDRRGLLPNPPTEISNSSPQAPRATLTQNK
jgi:hypothetical protein